IGLDDGAMGSEPRTGNRRIGQRLSIDPIEVTWVIPAPGLLRRNKTVEVPGRIVDVSVSGAGIEGPREPRVGEPGRVVTIRFRDSQSLVRLRRAAPGPT